MAISNRDRVGRVMDILRDGLGPYVLREYKMTYGGKGFAREIDDALRTGAFELPRDVVLSQENVEAVLLETIDTHGWLNLTWRRWNDVFSQRLGHSERSYISELMTARNDWAHQKAFTNEDAYRVADTAERLLKSVNVPDLAAEVHQIAQDLLRLRFEAEAKRAKKENGSLEKPPEITTQIGLMPWRQVVQPHPDVASGRYLMATFAADLAEVVEGKADPEYQDPLEFFRRTYLTEGLLNLLVTGLQRLTAQGGDPVVQLQTSFGGGKTHSMLALYHLAGARIQKLSDIPGGERIVERLGDIDPPEANRAVLVGTDLDPTRARQYPEALVHTLWGELAYQLGGIEGYRLVEKADQTGVSPGARTIQEILDTYGPCLIIIDELVAYVRNLYKVEGLPAGTYDAVMTFVQSLTEAVKRSDESLLLVSIPQSDIEIGGEGGRVALEMLSDVIGRIESVWKPVTATESFEIVRRRLFTETNFDYAARDAVVSAFGSMYRENATEFPSGVGESDYVDRMRAAYPIHPELFERLYQDWSTLERFQRTRGVLRLMAAVIHELWTRGDQSLLIMPGTMPLDTFKVRDEMVHYLPDAWPAIVDTDVDGSGSRPFALDSSVPNLGKYSASRRVSRTIFVGSAPSVAAQAVRGIEEVRIRLATVQPGEPAAVFGDALKRLSNQLTYLYTDGSRYWYDTHPTVNRLAKDRAQYFDEHTVFEEIHRRLKAIRRSGDFAGFHVVPPSEADVSDEQRARVVVLPINYTHRRTSGLSRAQEAARDILENRGTSPRIYRNMLVFIAPDDADTGGLVEATREYLAWQSISHEEEQLNLDAQQRSQVHTNLVRTDDTVDLRVRTTYSWLIVPSQPEPLGTVEFDVHRISGEENLYEKATRKLRQSGLLIPVWSPDMLRKEIDDHNLWQGNDHIKLKQLWEYLASYCYLSRLIDHEVLLDAIQAGVSRLDAPFAYAAGFDDGHYIDLIYRRHANILISDSSLLVRPEVAQRQIDEEERQRESDAPTPSSAATHPIPDRTTDSRPSIPSAVIHRRYHGRVQLNARRTVSDIGTIVDEVLQHLTALTDCDVEVSLEITAYRREGFEQDTIRTVTENSRTLKFENYGFEQD